MRFSRIRSRWLPSCLYLLATLGLTAAAAGQDDSPDTIAIKNGTSFPIRVAIIGYRSDTIAGIGESGYVDKNSYLCSSGWWRIEAGETRRVKLAKSDPSRPAHVWGVIAQACKISNSIYYVVPRDLELDRPGNAFRIGPVNMEDNFDARMNSYHLPRQPRDALEAISKEGSNPRPYISRWEYRAVGGRGREPLIIEGRTVNSKEVFDAWFDAAK